MLFLEDFEAGQIYGSESFRVTSEAIKDFAGQWDPQVFHLDEAGAGDSFFGGLAASGWHTGAITMRLLVTSPFKPVNGIIGAGLEELKWLRPVRPDDILSVSTEVLAVTPMRSKPGFGLVKVRVTTLDQHGQPVQVFVSPLVVQARG